MKTLTKREIELLEWAVEEAEVWRGTLVGNPDPEPLRLFDEQIAETKVALQKVIAINKQLNAWANARYPVSEAKK